MTKPKRKADLDRTKSSKRTDNEMEASNVIKRLRRLGRLRKKDLAANEIETLRRNGVGISPERIRGRVLSARTVKEIDPLSAFVALSRNPGDRNLRPIVASAFGQHTALGRLDADWNWSLRVLEKLGLPCSDDPIVVMDDGSWQPHPLGTQAPMPERAKLLQPGLDFVLGQEQRESAGWFAAQMLRKLRELGEAFEAGNRELVLAYALDMGELRVTAHWKLAHEDVALKGYAVLDRQTEGRAQAARTKRNRSQQVNQAIARALKVIWKNDPALRSNLSLTARSIEQMHLPELAVGDGYMKDGTIRKKITNLLRSGTV